MARVRNRSRFSLLGTLFWALLFVVVSAAWSPGWFGQVGLATLAVVGAGVLWNVDDVAAAWREDREAKRNR
jgi:uncharacterized membrane protein (DUF4010 family)